MPYIDMQGMHDLYRYDEPWDGPNNRQLAHSMPPIYAFNALRDPENTTTNYVAVVGRETAWPGSSPLSQEMVKDGLECTILIVEKLRCGHSLDGAQGLGL